MFLEERISKIMYCLWKENQRWSDSNLKSKFIDPVYLAKLNQVQWTESIPCLSQGSWVQAKLMNTVTSVKAYDKLYFASFDEASRKSCIKLKTVRKPSRIFRKNYLTTQLVDFTIPSTIRQKSGIFLRRNPKIQLRIVHLQHTGYIISTFILSPWIFLVSPLQNGF